MKTRMVSGKNLPASPSVNFIMPLSIIDQGACTAAKVRPSFIKIIICFIFYALALCQPHKTGRL
tara:strand:- start:500 stop:691 length:192 start_codon:yes stop_codon:yes gene_type:complete